MRLVLYSGGDLADNDELNEAALQMVDNRKPHFTYIPSAYENSDEYYEEFFRHFSDLGAAYFSVFHVDRPFTRKELRAVLKSDAIYLSGGNTYYFLKHLRESGVIHTLQQFVSNGGVLMGESAGSIIMTPDIRTAGYPEWDKDDNEVNLRDLRGMDLVNFDFFPHFEDLKSYRKELQYQSKLAGRPVYAVSDGSGIVVDYDKISFVGDCHCFIQGQYLRLY